MVRTTEILKSGVLVVGNEAADLAVVERMLRSAGYTAVTLTRKPGQAAALYRLHPYRIALLVGVSRSECDAPALLLEIGKPLDHVAVLTRVRDALTVALEPGTTKKPARRAAQRGFGGVRWLR